MIRLKGIKQSFDGVPVLRRLDCELPERGAVALMGSSGAGKTSLLRILAGLSAPEEGTVEGLSGKRICLMFQEDRLLEWYSALKNVMLVMPRPSETEARRILSQLRLDSADAMPGEMSGGMKRRVALARAIAFAPEVLLMDEPFSGLDLDTKRAIAPFVRNAAPLMIFATHDARETELLGADRVLLIQDGRVREAKTDC